MKKIVLALLLVTVIGKAGWVKTVGLWKDGRSYIRDGMLATLHEEGWSSVHSVVNEKEFWKIIGQLKGNGAEGILVIPIEKMIY